VQQLRLRVVFFRPNMKPQLYYIPGDAHKRELTMGIQYFESLSEEKLANFFRPPMAQKSTTSLILHCCGEQHA
jgi:hypothetical protein